MERPVETLLLAGMPGRSFAGGRTAATGEIPLTHSCKGVFCISLQIVRSDWGLFSLVYYFFGRERGND